MKEGIFMPITIDEENFSAYLQQRKMVLFDENSIGEIEDICGQLGDIEGTEECIERLIKLTKPYENMKIKREVWNVEYGFWEKVDKEQAIAELERDAKEGNL